LRAWDIGRFRPLQGPGMHAEREKRGGPRPSFGRGVLERIRHLEAQTSRLQGTSARQWAIDAKIVPLDKKTRKTGAQVVYQVSPVDQVSPTENEGNVVPKAFAKEGR